jgi:hypothetical protein
MGSVTDLFITYQFIKRLATPFDETEAFRLGLIDAKGKRLKKAATTQEKEAMTPFDRMIFNMKRLLAKLPGGDNRIKSYAAALLLLREEQYHTLDNLIEEIKNLKKNSNKDFRRLREDVPANATGAAVAGTGDDPVHWSNRHIKLGPKGNKKKMGRQISGVSFLKRRMKRSANNVTKNTA